MGLINSEVYSIYNPFTVNESSHGSQLHNPILLPSRPLREAIPHPKNFTASKQPATTGIAGEDDDDDDGESAKVDRVRSDQC